MNAPDRIKLRKVAHNLRKIHQQIREKRNEFGEFSLAETQLLGTMAANILEIELMCESNERAAKEGAES